MLTEFSVGTLKAYKMDQERTGSVCVYPAVIEREKNHVSRGAAMEFAGSRPK